MKNRIVDSEITLVTYYPNYKTALRWYQDKDLCKQVDNRDTVYDLPLLKGMYKYLDRHGDLYYIKYKNRLCGDVCLQPGGEVNIVIAKPFQNRHIGRRVLGEIIRLAGEKGIHTLHAEIYSFNTQSRRMFESMGFQQVGPEQYRLTLEQEPAYYKAYEARYKTIHSLGHSWAAENCTPIVLETIRKYGITPDAALLEIGCGEGRDARAVLEAGFRLTATDISPEAIRYCREKLPAYQERFHVMDCLTDTHDRRYDFLYAVAVVHMLVLDADRNGFYRFIRDHLTKNGLALICSMGDGEFEMQSDIRTAFQLQERSHFSGKVQVAGTSCRMVSFATFEAEIARNGLKIVEKGLCEAMPDFNSLLYAVVKRK